LITSLLFSVFFIELRISGTILRGHLVVLKRIKEEFAKMKTIEHVSHLYLFELAEDNLFS
tara:strand:- start:159 stop:338 length:180 start_codon:yes stop_codon:yes gene_type:complete